MTPLHSECEAVVAAAPDAVYAVVADVARRPRWLRELRAVDAPAVPLAPGVRFEGTSALFGHTFPGAAVVVRAEPGTVLAERVHVGACLSSEWTFEAVGDGRTRVRHAMAVELPGGPLRWLERLVLRRRLRVLQRAGLARLAAEVECAR